MLDATKLDGLREYFMRHENELPLEDFVTGMLHFFPSDKVTGACVCESPHRLIGELNALVSFVLCQTAAGFVLLGATFLLAVTIVDTRRRWIQTQWKPSARCASCLRKWTWTATA